MLILIAALLGNFGKFFLENYLQCPQLVSIGIVLTLLFLVFLQQRRYFAPAAAIAVLPQILFQENYYVFPIEVTLSSAFFVLIALIFFRAKKQVSLPHSS